MKLQNIREMNDRELYTFINNISNNNGRILDKMQELEQGSDSNE